MNVPFRGTRAELVARVRDVIAALAGIGPDPHQVAAPVLTRGGVALLSQIQSAFIAKARGGVGSDGIKWAPLKRATIAARRASKTELRKLGASGQRTRGLLTPEQDRKWRAVFASTLARLRARGTDGAAAIAAAKAWGVLKAEGAKTRLEVLGGRQVEILRDTSRLFRSLSPGVREDQAPKAEGQVFEAVPGRITVGTSVEYALAHHRGNPSRNLPARPLWPGALPDAWAAAVNRALVRGILDAVAHVARRGG